MLELRFADGHLQFMNVRGLLLFLVALPAAAAPIEVAGFKSDGWFLQDRVRADGTLRELQAGATVATAVKIPPLTDKEQEFGGDWRGVISVDFIGHTGDKPARLLFEAVDPATGEAFLSMPATVTQKVAPASWMLLSSSEAPDHTALHAHDLDDRSLWVSKKHQGENESPWLGMEVSEPVTVSAFHYVPRTDDSWQGAAYIGSSAFRACRLSP